MSDEDAAGVLVVIFDANPIWWSQQQRDGVEKVFTHCLESVLVFCNSYLLLKHTNQLAFIIAHPTESRFVYPQPETEQTEGKLRGTVRDGKYEGFMQIDGLVTWEMKDIMQNANRNSDGVVPSSLLSGALSKALCYIHRLTREQVTTKRLESKILIIKGSMDSSNQYMAMMNCIFAAQKKDTVIDCCALLYDSGFLQQAADITGGKYLKIEDLSGLLQYLLWVNLPDQTLSNALSLPSLSEVDYRAACFCHRKLVETGFVCSVCLSIYCQFRTQCITCQTRFKLPSLPFGAKPKKKKKE